ncbi:VOC family protein [soil metagenome]
MTLNLANVTLDCDDPRPVAAFWSAALDIPVDEGASEFFVSLGRDHPGPNWFFIKVPEDRAAKNRVHIDFETADRSAEIERLVGLGASKVSDHDEYGHSWTQMSDPVGNEFCVS